MGRTSIGRQRSHLLLDASIYEWMRASLSGWRPGICIKIPSARPRASTIRCGLRDDAAVVAERAHAIVAQLPDPPFWIPNPTGLLHSGADRDVGKGDA